MEKYKKYKEAFPNKTDAQCIESLCWEVSDKVETIHKLLQDMADKKYTEEDMLKASKYGYEFRNTTSFPQHKFEDSCINNTKQWIQSLNKQD